MPTIVPSGAPSCHRPRPRAPLHALDRCVIAVLSSENADNATVEAPTRLGRRSWRGAGLPLRAWRGAPPQGVARGSPSGRGAGRAPGGGSDPEPGVAVSPPAPADLRSILALPPVATGAIADPQRGGA